MSLKCILSFKASGPMLVDLKLFSMCGTNSYGMLMDLKLFSMCRTNLYGIEVNILRNQLSFGTLFCMLHQYMFMLLTEQCMIELYIVCPAKAISSIIIHFKSCLPINRPLLFFLKLKAGAGSYKKKNHARSYIGCDYIKEKNTQTHD